MHDVPTVVTARLELVSLSEELLGALLLGDRARAEALGGFHLPEGWPPPEDTGFLLMRLQDLRDARVNQEWLLRALVLRGPERMLVGHVGFHGPPDAQRRLEVGYEVLPRWRGQGFAHEAVEALLAWATREHAISHFIASVAPGNAPSLRLVERLGFQRTGTQWDERDGEELVFERAAHRAPR